MNNVSFSHEKALWDSWERPYNTVSDHFSLFDTGEVVFTEAHMALEDRKYYPDIGLSIRSSSEVAGSVANPITTPEGVKVAKAHIVYDASGETRQQLLIVDEGKQEIYNVVSPRIALLPNVPDAIAQYGTIYWASRKHRPVCHPIRLVTPRKLTPEQKERKEECELLCKSVVALKNLVRFTRVDQGSLQSASEMVYDLKVPLVDIVPHLTDNTVHCIAGSGVPTKQTRYVPYLKF